MQINQKRRAPRVADSFKLAGQKFVIGSMDVINPGIKLFARQRSPPDLSKSWQAPWDQAQATARAPIGASGAFACDRLRNRIAPPRAADHIPIDIVMGPVKIKHGARGVRDQQSGARRFGNRDTQVINMTVFQPKLAHLFVSKASKNMIGISSPGMRDRNQNRQRHRSRSRVRKSRAAIRSAALRWNPASGKRQDLRAGLALCRRGNGRA